MWQLNHNIVVCGPKSLQRIDFLRIEEWRGKAEVCNRSPCSTKCPVTPLQRGRGTQTAPSAPSPVRTGCSHSNPKTQLPSSWTPSCSPRDGAPVEVPLRCAPTNNHGKSPRSNQLEAPEAIRTHPFLVRSFCTKAWFYSWRIDADWKMEKKNLTRRHFVSEVSVQGTRGARAWKETKYRHLLVQTSDSLNGLPPEQVMWGRIRVPEAMKLERPSSNSL